LIAPFVEALIREVAILGTNQPSLVIHTIYFGGGTPSMLTPEQLRRILSAVRQHFVVQADAETSMEANPDDLDSQYMAAVRDIGINRLSIGMQSANTAELELFARRHDFATVIQAVSAARVGKFENLNLDLIYGVPGQTISGWENSLREMLALKPEHISLYALGLEDGTSMKSWVESGRLSTPDDDLAADMYELASDMLEDSGYLQYEISNWSRPGYKCRHNLQYWRNLPYPGLGPGAHGYAGGVRYSTILSPHRYITAMQDAKNAFPFPMTPATDRATVVDREAEISETLIMGLRLIDEGIQRAVFKDRFQIDLVDLYPAVIERFSGYGLLSVDEHVVRLTKRGRLLSNVIFREFV
jgi:oxygen-independent coproporphyrinogen-3 oxidase